MCPSIIINGNSISTYGLAMAIGFVAGFLLLMYTRRAAKDGAIYAYAAAVSAALCGLVGSKLLYIIVELDALLSGALEWSAVISAGFVFYGGLIGGIGGIALVCAVKRLSFLSMLDALVPCVCIGQAIGRIGCHYAGCCYGCVWDGPLSVVYPDSACIHPGQPVMPVQLMEAAYLVLLCAVLIACLHPLTRRAGGLVTCVYLIGYSVWRFVIEFYRDDPRGAVGILSTSQLISIVLFAAGAVLLAVILMRKPNTV